MPLLLAIFLIALAFVAGLLVQRNNSTRLNAALAAAQAELAALKSKV